MGRAARPRWRGRPGLGWRPDAAGERVLFAKTNLFNLISDTDPRAVRVLARRAPACTLSWSSGAGPGSVVVGVDTGKLCIKRSKAHGPDGIVYAVADGWDLPTLMKLEPDFDAIYVDVGGLSGADGLAEALALLRQLECAFRPTLRFLVIKSRCVRDHAQAFTHADPILRPYTPASV